jgi:pSer/pThr/pTyr-binding forkhead associated (FHA) protein
MSEFKAPSLPVKRSVAAGDKEESSIERKACFEAQKPPEQPPLPYHEPSWSGLPEDRFVLEVIKNGSLINEINVTEKSFFVFGRLPACDVVLDHPSISRYHAILQYRSSTKSLSDNEQDPLFTSGFYLYDLGSTHGTLINKEKIRPKTYYRLRVGHMMKFGGSTRLFVLQTNSRCQDEVERQAEKEIQEVMNERKKKEDEREEERREIEQMRAKVLEEGVTWGISDEAEEEAERQFQLGQSITEIDEDAYYNKDPKKALNHYFEEEGLEVEYEVEEVGQGKDKKFHARIRLPIETSEGGYIYGEATIGGKKKDAVVACALDACRILDTQGMLRATAGQL